MRYSLLLHSNEADSADFTPEQWGELKVAYGAYIQSLNAVSYTHLTLPTSG